MKNHIVDVTITPTTLTNMHTNADALMADIRTFGVNLDEAERQYSAKMGTRNENFCLEMLEFALQRPDLMPAAISVPAIGRDKVAREQLTSLLFKLETMVQTVRDTHMALGIDLYNGTRALYKGVKPLAPIYGVQDVIERIGQRFQGQGRRPKSTVENNPENNHSQPE